MADRWKQIAASFLAFGALAIPGFSGLVTALGGDAGIMQAVVGAYAVYHVVRLAVDYVHGAVAGVFLLGLLLPASAYAQEPAPTPVAGQHGAAYVSYGYTSGAAASLDNLQFDLDVALPGTAVSVAGHFTDQSGAHVGPSGSYQVGPINIFGRHLFLVGGDALAAAAIGNKTGGGIEIPLPRGAILRLGIHTYQKGASGPNEITVGFGARF